MSFIAAYNPGGLMVMYVEAASRMIIAKVRFQDDNGAHTVELSDIETVTNLRSQISNLQAELDRTKGTLAATQHELAAAKRLHDDAPLSDDERPVFLVKSMEGWAHVPLADAHAEARKTVEGIVKRGGSPPSTSIYKKIGTLSATSRVETRWEDA